MRAMHWRVRPAWADEPPCPPKLLFLLGMGEVGGPEEDRTPDLLIANEALSQLSYGPTEGREL
jgi:hypothetical protein